MISSEIKRLIREEIKRYTDIVIGSQAGPNTRYTESCQNMASVYPNIEYPIAHPYGYCSRAAAGTVNLTVRQGDRPDNRIVISHRDVNRPEINGGEVLLYNEHGQRIYLENGNIRIGTMDTDNKAVVGNELKSMLQELITLISTHTHITSAPGAPTSAPNEATQFLEIKANNVDNDEILSNYVFVDKG